MSLCWEHPHSAASNGILYWMLNHSLGHRTMVRSTVHFSLFRVRLDQHWWDEVTLSLIWIRPLEQKHRNNPGCDQRAGPIPGLIWCDSLSKPSDNPDQHIGSDRLLESPQDRHTVSTEDKLDEIKTPTQNQKREKLSELLVSEQWSLSSASWTADHSLLLQLSSVDAQSSAPLILLTAPRILTYLTFKQVWGVKASTCFYPAAVWLKQKERTEEYVECGTDSLCRLSEFIPSSCWSQTRVGPKRGRVLSPAGDLMFWLREDPCCQLHRTTNMCDNDL